MVWVELLAARGVRRRRVFAKRSWPPGCGRFPAAPDAGESERGVVEGRAEAVAGHTVVSPAACNGGLPHALPQPQPEGVVEEGDGDALLSDGERESSAIDLLPLKGKEGQGSGQLVRDVVLTGDGDAMATRSRAGDGQSERKEDRGRKKRWLMSTVSAMRGFPLGCGRAAVTGTGGLSEQGLVVEDTPISFASESASVVDPISGFGASNEEMERKTMEVEGVTMAHNRIQESQIVNRVGPHDFAGGRHDGARPRDVITKDSPRHGFSKKMKWKRPLHQVKHVAQVARDGRVKIKCEGSSQEGTPNTPARGLVDVKIKDRRLESVKMNETLLDNVGVSEEGTAGDKNPCTQRSVMRSNVNVKQDMFACKMMPGGKGHNSLNRLAKESKSENDDLDIGTNRIIVQALIAPNKFPLTQGRKSIASVSWSLTPRNKLKKKVATYRKELPPKVAVTPSTSTRHKAIEDKEDSSSEDDENSMALVKQDMFACKLKPGGKGHGSLIRLTKDSKSENNSFDLFTSRIIVQALMAPNNFSLTQEKKSISSVSRSLTPRYKLQKKGATSRKELPLHKATRKSEVCEDLCLRDISKGKESIPIRVVNTIDDMQPMPFKYITKVIYPPSYAREPPKGCDCTKRCYDSSGCACAVKNGGEIPFNFNSEIVEEKPLIYECGPSCRCPPTCHNRVSQHGAKIPLEIFKTEKRGWGVRSLSYISSGSFVCEYVGELLQEAEAEKTENDEYLFDIGRNYDDEESETMEEDVGSDDAGSDDVGYTIDSAKCGNVGRFINHSCSPNLYPQNVLWDHDDKTMPHVMLFAYENILPLQELTYDYNYKIGKVRDNNGQEKVKPCCCGSSNCRRRLY